MSLWDPLVVLLRSNKRIGILVLAGLSVAAAAAAAYHWLPDFQSGLLAGCYIVVFGLLASMLSLIVNDQTLGRLLATIVVVALVVGLIGLVATLVFGLPRGNLPSLLLGMILVIITPAGTIYLVGKMLSTVVAVQSIAFGFGVWCLFLLLCFVSEPIVKHFWPTQIVDYLSSGFGSAFAVACYILISASALTAAATFLVCCFLLALNSRPDRNDRRDRIIISFSGGDHS